MHHLRSCGGKIPRSESHAATAMTPPFVDSPRGVPIGCCRSVGSSGETVRGTSSVDGGGWLAGFFRSLTSASYHRGRRTALSLFGAAVADVSERARTAMPGRTTYER